MELEAAQIKAYFISRNKINKNEEETVMEKLKQQGVEVVFGGLAKKKKTKSKRKRKKRERRGHVRRGAGKKSNQMAQPRRKRKGKGKKRKERRWAREERKRGWAELWAALRKRRREIIRNWYWTVPFLFACSFIFLVQFFSSPYLQYTEIYIY